jgi:hypothetical protein
MTTGGAMTTDAPRVAVRPRVGVRPRRRRRWGNQRGQAMVLASIGIFVMCLAVLATFNLGHAVHQKIRLQNTADSAAYTLAAMEARTFNYIAFLNRVQIAHYNTAMMTQSFISWVGFQRAMFATAVDILISVQGSILLGASWPCPGPGCVYQALVGGIQGAVQAAKGMKQGFDQAFAQAHKLAHQFAQAMAIFNKDVIWHAQLTRAALMNVNIMSGMQNYIEKNDPDISFKNGKSVFLNVIVNGALNSLEYYHAFDKSSGVNPFAFTVVQNYMKLKKDDTTFGGFLKPKNDTSGGGGGDKPTRIDAYRIMTEISHASRSPKFVFNRGGAAGGMFPVGALVAVIAGKKGATKLTSEGKRDNAEIRAISKDPDAKKDAGGKHDSSYVPGEYLSSHDYATFSGGFGFFGASFVGWGGKGNKLGDAVANYAKEVDHYRYKGTDKQGSQGQGYHPGGFMGGFPPVAGQEVKGETESCNEKSGKWPGLAPFFKFNANKERTSDYGQPSTWIFLNKHHRDFQSKWGSHAEGKAPWYAKFTIDQGGQQASLDTTVGGSRNSYLFEGLNVVARGMAYYHRPGNWGETPNFFNPFWRARLAPVGQKLQNFWDKYVSSKITTSSDSAATKALVNVLRNAQMDLFTSAITSLICH